jgi:hypothetical protein
MIMAIVRGVSWRDVLSGFGVEFWEKAVASGITHGQVMEGSLYVGFQTH